MRRDGEKIGKRTPGKHLQAVLERLKPARPGLGWYEATRHTFASHWVLAGGSTEKLKEFQGHHSVVVTERYTHLRPDLFAAQELNTIAVDLRPGAPDPVHVGPKQGHTSAAGAEGSVTQQKVPERPCKPSSVPGLTAGW